MSASPEALSYGRKVAATMMNNRKGHGGAQINYRRLDEASIAALVALAFDAGKNSVKSG